MGKKNGKRCDIEGCGEIADHLLEGINVCMEHYSLFRDREFAPHPGEIDDEKYS